MGTTEFDALLRKIDNLVENKKIRNEVIAQIGNGSYVPKNIKFFRFAKSLIPFLKKAKLIISHAGAATIFECLELKKKLIVIENPDVRRDAKQFLKELSSKNYLIWCKHIDQLLECIESANTIQLNYYSSPKCTISEKIINFLNQNM
ncbi:MAG: PssE/Cps14G family polysaccharide biosynthesis glycosyltransferase [Candidatus Heimdallarchaeota archaeon]